MTNRILSKAADIIEEKGWSQGTYSNEKGNVCASRAIRDANEAFGFKDFGDEYYEARSILKKEIDTTSIPHWNDKKGQTKANVIKTLRSL